MVIIFLMQLVHIMLHDLRIQLFLHKIDDEINYSQEHIYEKIIFYQLIEKINTRLLVLYH